MLSNYMPKLQVWIWNFALFLTKEYCTNILHVWFFFYFKPLLITCHGPFFIISRVCYWRGYGYSKRISKEQDKYGISFTNEDSYTKPYPLLLNTTFKIREFISIDENEHSISIRVNLLSKWKDSGLKCSDKMDQ